MSHLFIREIFSLRVMVCLCTKHDHDARINVLTKTAFLTIIIKNDLS